MGEAGPQYTNEQVHAMQCTSGLVVIIRNEMPLITDYKCNQPIAHVSSTWNPGFQLHPDSRAPGVGEDKGGGGVNTPH